MNNKSEKIILIIGALSFGGAERVICNIANKLAEIGDEVVLIAVHTRESAYSIDKRVRVINGLSGKRPLSKLVALRKILKKEKPRAALSFLTHINLFAILATLGVDTKLVISERNDPAREPKNLGRRLMRRLLYPLSDGFVFQTEQAKDFFSKYIQDRSAVIPNPVFLDAVERPKARKKKIVNVGRLVQQKRQDNLIRAFKIVNEMYPEYTLDIFGEGPEKENLNSLIKNLKLEHAVSLKGSVKNLHDQIKDASIFVLTSDFEGMPNVLMEAMALGIPCISTDCPVGGPRALISHMENGLLVPVSDNEELVEAIELLIKNKQMQEKFSKESIKVLEDYSLEKISAKWRDFLLK